MSPFGAEPILDSYLVVGLVLAALGGLLLLGPQFGSVSPQRRWALVGLRLLAIFLLALALLRPNWVHEVRTPRRPVLIVLFDISRSMQLPSGQGETTRWQVQQETLHKAEEILTAAAAKMDVRVYAYDGKLLPIDIAGGKFAWPAQPTGEQTDVGSALGQALRAEAGKRVAGVVLLGDGVQTAFDPQIESQEAGRKLRDEFGAPLIAAAIGPSGDAATGRDVAVERLGEQFTVFVKNELTVKALVRIRGYVKQDVPLELQLETAPGKHETIGKKTVRADEDGRQVEVTFQYTPKTPGHFRLRVNAPQQPGELVTKNNQLTAYLTVLDGGLRVLYLEGEKRFEHKFLTRSLNASPDIELDDRILDKRGRNRWPVNLGDDLTSSKYDALIIGDLEAAALGPANLEALAKAVGQGKGLLMLGGLRTFGRGKYHTTALGEVLPIEIDRIEGSEFGQRDPDEFFLDGPVRALPTEGHPLTRLASDAENHTAWTQLPPLLWAYKFAGVKQAPGVRVLLETTKGAPLLVSGEYGRGRVLTFAGQSTYLWTMHGKELEHKRFWRQVVLWLVRREDVDKSEVWVRLDQRRFQPGGKVLVTAGARTATGDPLPEARLLTTLIHPTGQRELLKMSADKQQFAGQVVVQEPGDYAIETVAIVADKELGKARTEFMVYDRDVELSNPAADPAHFLALTSWTKEVGGKLVAPEQVPVEIEGLTARPVEYEVRQTRWRLAGTSGEAWLLLLFFAGVFGGEWFLRKKWGLV